MKKKKNLHEKSQCSHLFQNVLDLLNLSPLISYVCAPKWLLPNFALVASTLNLFWAQSPWLQSPLVSLTTFPAEDLFPPTVIRVSRAEDGRGSQTAIYGIETAKCNHPRRKNSRKGKGSETEKGQMGRNRQSKQTKQASSDHPFQSLTFSGIPGVPSGPGN